MKIKNIILLTLMALNILQTRAANQIATETYKAIKKELKDPFLDLLALTSFTNQDRLEAKVQEAEEALKNYKEKYLGIQVIEKTETRVIEESKVPMTEESIENISETVIEEYDPEGIISRSTVTEMTMPENAAPKMPKEQTKEISYEEATASFPEGMTTPAQSAPRMPKEVSAVEIIIPEGAK